MTSSLRLPLPPPPPPTHTGPKVWNMKVTTEAYPLAPDKLVIKQEEHAWLWVSLGNLVDLAGMDKHAANVEHWISLRGKERRGKRKRWIETFSWNGLSEMRSSESCIYFNAHALTKCTSKIRSCKVFCRNKRRSLLVESSTRGSSQTLKSADAANRTNAPRKGLHHMNSLWKLFLLLVFWSS